MTYMKKGERKTITDSNVKWREKGMTYRQRGEKSHSIQEKERAGIE